MSSKEKKSWTKPTHLKFESAHDAIAYYSERGMFEHVAAIKKMSAQRE